MMRSNRLSSAHHCNLSCDGSRSTYNAIINTFHERSNCINIVKVRGRPICVFQGRYDTDYYRSSRPITDILNRYTCLV